MTDEALGQLVIFGLVIVALWPWPSFIAYKKGREFLPVLLFTVLFYPAALIMAIFMKRNQYALDERRLAKGEERKCPYCASFMRREAIVCPSCHRDLPASIPQSADAPSPGIYTNAAVIDRGSVDGRDYTLHGDGLVISRIDGAPHTWRDIQGFRSWAESNRNRSD